MEQETYTVAQLMDRFEQVCRTKGLRVTHQRIEIYKALVNNTNHPTIEDIFSHVRTSLKTISLDTVYRTINTFEEYGLLKRVHHIDNVTRFDVNITNHHHLVCSKCNKIEDFQWPDFDKMTPPKEISRWGDINVKHVVIDGLCSTCREKNKTKNNNQIK